jgi:hypothetical protein
MVGSIAASHAADPGQCGDLGRGIADGGGFGAWLTPHRVGQFYLLAGGSKITARSQRPTTHPLGGNLRARGGSIFVLVPGSIAGGLMGDWSGVGRARLGRASTASGGSWSEWSDEGAERRTRVVGRAGVPGARRSRSGGRGEVEPAGGNVGAASAPASSATHDEGEKCSGRGLVGGDRASGSPCSVRASSAVPASAGPYGPGRRCRLRLHRDVLQPDEAPQLVRLSLPCGVRKPTKTKHHQSRLNWCPFYRGKPSVTYVPGSYPLV